MLISREIIYFKNMNSCCHQLRDISISDAFGESRRLVSNSGWWLLFLYVLLLGVAGQILTLIPILNLVYIFVFPYFIMMQLEAYILVTDAENNSEN